MSKTRSEDEHFGVHVLLSPPVVLLLMLSSVKRLMCHHEARLYSPFVEHSFTIRQTEMQSFRLAVNDSQFQRL